MLSVLQAQCTSPMHLDTALALIEEMRSRNIQPNTHTYSSLLNVCVKAGQLNMALGVYNEVRVTSACRQLHDVLGPSTAATNCGGPVHQWAGCRPMPGGSEPGWPFFCRLHVRGRARSAYACLGW
jgi:pentatricopeptide repeat protein